MLLMIDNYDSFTFNLVQYFGELGEDVRVFRNDKIGVAEVLKLAPKGIVLSPGPCTPNEAGICLELIEKAGPTIPLLGVCLGHQALGQVYGGKDVVGRDLVVAMDDDVGAQPAQIVDQVEGEAVVVVDQDDHGCLG